MPDFEVVFNVNIPTRGDMNVRIPVTAPTLEQAIDAAKLNLVQVTTLKVTPTPAVTP